MVLHVLSSAATDLQLQRILNLSNTVFGVSATTNQTDHHSSLSAWRTHLDSDERACIIYATCAIADSPHVTVDDSDTRTVSTDEPLGYFFIYPKIQPEIGIESMHIWMAAVRPDVQGQGVFSTLMAETRRRTVDAGLRMMTICTMPDRFQRMYAILQRAGWELVAWREGDSLRKVLMRLRVKRL